MGRVVLHPKADDPEALWPGAVSVNREGVSIAFEMLCELESGEPDLANVENWPREGKPFRNVVLEYLSRAREGGCEVEAGFCAVLSDFAAQVSAGSIPGAGFYENLYNLEGSG